MRWFFKMIAQPNWRKLCQPSLVVRRLHEVELPMLLDRNITTSIIDTDGVTVVFGSRNIPDENIDWVDFIRNQGIKCYLMTFNHKNSHAIDIGNYLGIEVLAGCYNDPVQIISNSFMKLLHENGIQKHQIAVINDSLFCLGLFRMVAPECTTIFVQESLGFTHYHFFESMLMRLIFGLETLFLKRKYYRS